MTRILLCGDFSQTPTGFGKYQRTLVKGFQEHGYEIAELGHNTYLPDKQHVPWKLYTTAIFSYDKDYEEFKKNPANVHGLWRWEKCVLDFKPDIVISPLDPWQFYFQAFSSLKPYYHLVLAPTVDSIPQKPEYINIYRYADTLVTYSRFGKKALESEGLSIKQYIPMGIDTEIFKPISSSSKPLHKMANGLPKDSIIIGFVARNNPRKRIPELLKSFRQLINSTDKNVYLYLHTTYPDSMWDIPSLLIEYGIYDKVYFTYRCKESRKWFASLYKDIRTLSPYTNKLTGEFVTLRNSVSEYDLSEIYNLFDVYIQCASNEGFGVPVIEAAACNVPIVTINHSAMSEIAEDIGAEYIKCSEYRDWNTGSDKACINCHTLSQAMLKMINNIPTVDYRSIILEKYSYESFLTSWLKLVREIENGYINKWKRLARKIDNINIDIGNSNSVKISILSQHIQAGWSYNTLKKLEDLNTGTAYSRRAMDRVTLNNIVDEFNSKIDSYNKYEHIRIGEQPLIKESWMR